MSTYTVYRVPNQFYVTYKPVIRNGKPVAFKKRKDAEQWLTDNPPKSTASLSPTFEVRRTIKKRRNA